MTADGVILDPDVPYALADPAERVRRLGLVREPHVEALNAWVDCLRAGLGAEFCVPYFDPLDGGVGAHILVLLEAPGTKAKLSGFVSRNNPDPTARNYGLLLSEAGIPRRETVVWNAVPWFIGRPPRPADLSASKPHLAALLMLLPRLAAVVLLGNAAQRLFDSLPAPPDLAVYRAPHTSLQSLNRRPGNRARVLDAFRAASLRGGPPGG